MERYTLPAQLNRVPDAPRAVALGLFDGLHSGHRAVIAETLKSGHRCAVYTFAPATVTTKPGTQWLMPEEELHTQLEKSGVQDLFVTDFASVQQMSPAQFVDEVLVGLLHAQTVVCGFNYRFGEGGSGDTDTLTNLCAAHGIAVTVVPPTKTDGETVSSTAVRAALTAGDMPKARRMLSHAYCLRLTVTEGQHLGRRLGMPTINQPLPRGLLAPRFGVYASSIEIGDQVYHGVTNIGMRPTVGTDSPLAETWIDDFDGDVYGQTVAIYPVKFLRQEQKFDSLDALQTQMQADAEAARALFAPTGKIRAVLCDFDDTMHKRDDAFRKAVDAFFYRYHPALSEDAHRQLAEDMMRFNRYGYGMSVSFHEFIEMYLTVRQPVAEVTPQDAMRQFFIDYAAACEMEPDVVPTLAVLRKKGLLLGAVTNGGSLPQNGKVDMTGLRPYLDITAVGGDEEVQKPHPTLFKRIAARLGVACEDCVFVGDHPENDIYGALNAGMRAVCIDYGHPADHPCYATPVPEDVPIIHTFAELPAALDLLSKIQ